jgi:hypothetical protein
MLPFRCELFYLFIMDQNIFHIDWFRLLEVLAGIVVLSFLLERALSLLFESRFFIKRLSEKGLKEIIAFVLCAAVCMVWHLDAISLIFASEGTNIFGEIITGAIVAGGSKASILLFRNVMGIMSNAERLRMAQKKKEIKEAGIKE